MVMEVEEYGMYESDGRMVAVEVVYNTTQRQYLYRTKYLSLLLVQYQRAAINSMRTVETTQLFFCF